MFFAAKKHPACTVPKNCGAAGQRLWFDTPTDDWDSKEFAPVLQTVFGGHDWVT